MSKVEETMDEVDDYDQKLKFLNKIACPLANKKLTKRLFKCVKKGRILPRFLTSNLNPSFKHPNTKHI